MPTTPKRQTLYSSHVEIRGPWEVTFYFADVNGRAECVGLDIRSFHEEVDPQKPRPRRPVSPKRGLQVLGSKELRTLTAGSIAEARSVEADLMKWAAKEAKIGRPARKAVARRLEELRRWEGPKKGRPIERLPDFYHEVAELFIQASLAGTPAPPVRAVIKAKGVTESTAYRWVRTAVAQGLIPEELAPHGRGAGSRKAKGRERAR